MESPSSPAHTGRLRLAWRLSLGSETRCCKRPGVVGPLTPVGSLENTLLMKRVRAVLSRTQIPSTASSNASGTDFHHNTVRDTPALGSVAGLTNELSNTHSVAR